MFHYLSYCQQQVEHSQRNFVQEMLHIDNKYFDQSQILSLDVRHFYSIYLAEMQKILLDLFLAVCELKSEIYQSICNIPFQAVS